MVLIIDPQNAGIAGNMIAGAFIDLGCDPNEIKEIMETVASEFGGVNVNVRKINKSGIESTYLEVETLDKENNHNNNHNNNYSSSNHNNDNDHSISYKSLLAKIDEIEKALSKNKDDLIDQNLIDDVFNISKRIFERIAKGEAKVHGKPLDEVHFHEVGAADAVADVFGSVFAYCRMGFNKIEENVIGLPIALGGGTTETFHGKIPIPAPAVVEMLAGEENVFSLGGPVNSELATPTGIALYLELCDEFKDFQPMLKSDGVGYGAGKNDFDFPNVLRLIKGKSQVKYQTIDVIETNIDHLSGETIGYLFEKLMKEGARDVAIVPIIMKKNRPGHLLKVVSKKNTTNKLLDVIFKETGTLGIRVSQHSHRGVASRKIISLNIDIHGEKEDINFKIGFIGDEIISSRGEYEDIKKIAYKRDIPLEEVTKIVNFEIENYLLNNEIK